MPATKEILLVAELMERANQKLSEHLLQQGNDHKIHRPVGAVH